jgi:hypothetical protein
LDDDAAGIAHARWKERHFIQAGQPTMTIEALAFRAGEHIAKFARANEI